MKTKNTLQIGNGSLGFIETLHKQWWSLLHAYVPFRTWAELHFQRYRNGRSDPKGSKNVRNLSLLEDNVFSFSISHRNNLNRCNNNFTLQIDFVVSVQLEGIKIFNWNAYKILGLNDPLYNDGLGVYSVLIKLGQHTEALYTLKQVLHVQQFRLDMRNCIIDRCTKN